MKGKGIGLDLEQACKRYAERRGEASNEPRSLHKGLRSLGTLGIL